MNHRDGFICQYSSLCVGAILYGGFLISIPRSIRAFIRQYRIRPGPERRSQWGLHVIAAMLFILVTLDISLQIARFGLIVPHCYMNGPAQDRNCDPMPWFKRIITFIVAFSTLLTEGVMIYRCWVLHSRRWIVTAAPSLLWLYALGMAIYITASGQNYSGDVLQQEMVDSALQIGFWVVIIVLKFLTTALIVRRVLIQKSEPSQADEASPLNSVIRFILESGLMSIVASLFVLGSLFCEIISLSASTVMIMVSGISYNLISIRVDQRRRKTERKSLADSSLASSMICFSNRFLLTPPPPCKC